MPLSISRGAVRPDPKRCTVPTCTGWAFYRVGKMGFCEQHKAEARRAAGATK